MLIKPSLPDALEVKPIADQSVFVRASIQGVIREGVIAAALTSLMILLFLGSWRSTLIVTTSIPLSILGAIATLSAIGETLNIMTLGGLALAVGILVDEATVTIESINYHLEQGKPVEAAIIDGASQIVVPAFVSLLCICIVFIPMFFLSGVARFLFVPMAESVMFAMVFSFLLSRTLVPTMAKYLLRMHVGSTAHGGLGRPRRTRWCAFSAASRRASRGCAPGITICWRSPSSIAGCSSAAFSASWSLSFLLTPFLGRNFFPQVDGGQMLLHVRAPVGMRIEETAARFNEVEKAIREIIPPAEMETVVDNIGTYLSSINTIYNNTGTIGESDGDIQISLNEGHAPTADYVARLRERAAAPLPRHDFLVPARRHRQPDPQFRRARRRSIVQVRGNDLDADFAYANKLLAQLRHVTGVADARIQQSAASAHAQCQHRPHARAVHRRDRGRCDQQPGRQPRQLHPGGAHLLAEREERRHLSDRAADAAIPDRHAAGAAESADQRDRRADHGARRHRRHPARRTAMPWSRSTTSPRWSRSTRPRKDRDLGAVSGDIRKIIADNDKDKPKGSTVALVGQTATMYSAYTGLLFGLLGAIVLIYFLIVINFQSWSDPFVIITALPAALAGIVWMLFGTHTTLSVPALTGAIMCMGVATANSVLVISFAREKLTEFGDATQAALEAGFVRLRPVLMTALAMVIGMLPMALGSRRRRRAERAARPRRDRRPDLRHRLDALLRPCGVQHSSPAPWREAHAGTRPWRTSCRLIQVPPAPFHAGCAWSALQPSPWPSPSSPTAWCRAPHKTRGCAI